MVSQSQFDYITNAHVLLQIINIAIKIQKKIKMAQNLSKELNPDLGQEHATCDEVKHFLYQNSASVIVAKVGNN